MFKPYQSWCVRLDNTRQQARTKPPAEYMAEAGCRQTAEIGKNTCLNGPEPWHRPSATSCTRVHGVRPEQLSGPLSAFQATQATRRAKGRAALESRAIL